MIRILLLTTIFSGVLFFQGRAQDNPIFPKGSVAKNTSNYTGTIWLQELNHPDSMFTFSLAQAVYAPGSKLDWHIHPGGQYLLITEGSGFYQERGKAVQVVRKGDVVKCMPGVEHWHAATPKSSFAYIGVTPTQNGKTRWLENVTEAQYHAASTAAGIQTGNNSVEQEIINLSRQKWQWMADKNADTLANLFHEKSVFVHMGGSWGKEREVNVIKSGGIWYKKADIHDVSVNIMGSTAVLLNRITLLAEVGGREVTNPFMVTEVYVKEASDWKLASLSFTKLLTPGDAQR